MGASFGWHFQGLEERHPVSQETEGRQPEGLSPSSCPRIFCPSLSLPIPRLSVLVCNRGPLFRRGRVWSGPCTGSELVLPGCLFP